MRVPFRSMMLGNHDPQDGVAGFLVTILTESWTVVEICAWPACCRPHTAGTAVMASEDVSDGWLVVDSSTRNGGHGEP